MAVKRQQLIFWLNRWLRKYKPVFPKNRLKHFYGVILYIFLQERATTINISIFYVYGEPYRNEAMNEYSKLKKNQEKKFRKNTFAIAKLEE